jgi:hypothetical protein
VADGWSTRWTDGRPEEDQPKYQADLWRCLLRVTRAVCGPRSIALTPRLLRGLYTIVTQVVHLHPCGEPTQATPVKNLEQVSSLNTKIIASRLVSLRGTSAELVLAR